MSRAARRRAALEEAYKHSIMVGKFPACVLNLSIPFTETDINVHPAKIEVRFTNERPVFDAVYYGVKSALAKSDYTPLPPQQPKKPMTVFDLERHPEVEQQALEQIIRQQQPKQQVPQRMTAQEYRQMVGEKPAKPKTVRQEEKLTFHDHSPQRVQWEPGASSSAG